MSEQIRQFSRIEELIGKLEKTADPAALVIAKELVQLLMEVHGSGLERMMEIAAQSGAAGMEMIDRFGEDELARNLLLLYGLHPVELESRVERALGTVRPYLRSRDADVELIAVSDGVAKIRLTGSAHGCTATTLKAAIEEALYKEAPDLTAVSVAAEADTAASGFVPLGELRTLTVTGR